MTFHPDCDYPEVEACAKAIGRALTPIEITILGYGIGSAEARVEEMRKVLAGLLEDSQHAEHSDCEEGPCPVREARECLSRAKAGGA